MSRIAAVHLRPYRLSLTQPWRMAGVELATRSGWLVGIETAGGLTGWGDCSAPPGHGVAGADEDSLRGTLQGMVGSDIDSALERLSGPAPARAAVECALLDLMAQEQGLPLRRLLDPGAAARLAVNGVAEFAGLAEAVALGFRTVKIKVGRLSEQIEAEALNALEIPPGVRLRLDANQAWSWDEASRFLDAVGDLPIESLEEPLARPSLARLGLLQSHTDIDLALDESLPVLGPRAVVDLRPVRRLILKVGPLGGLRACHALALRARAADMDCVVTSAVDSAVGVAAAAHLAAAVDGKGLAHGLSTGQWLAEDVAEGLRVVEGSLTFDERPGLGVSPRP